MNAHVVKKEFVKVFSKYALRCYAWVYFALLFVFGPGLSFFSFVSWINYGEFLWSNVVFHAFRSCQIAQKIHSKNSRFKQCYHDFSIHWNSFQVKGQSLSSSPSFTPIVSATCRAGMMTVKVETQDNFLGVVQSRDYRKPECSGYGENTRITYLRINMLAQTEEKEYCGVFISQVCNFIFDINLAKSIMVIG